MKSIRLHFGALSMILLSTAALAESPGSAIRAVSPGDDAMRPTIADGCPTFSWSAATNALRHELEVWLIAAGDANDVAATAESRRLYRTSVAGSAGSWTPSTERCLSPGGRYAWIVRPVFAEGAGDWSTALSFEVASIPSQREVAAALAVLRRFVDRAPQAGGAPADVGRATPRRSRVTASRPTSPGGAGVEPTVEAVRGEASDTTGAAFGVSGISHSGAGGGVRAENAAGGADLVLAGGVAAALSETGLDRSSPADQLFSLGNSGGGTLGLVVEGGVTAVSFAGSGTALSGVDAVTLGGQLPESFAPDSHGHFGQNFSGDSPNFGLRVNNSGSGRAVFGFLSSNAISSNAATYGESAAQGGVGVGGRVTDAASVNVGVLGESFSVSGTGVEGNATGTGNLSIGVRGRSASSFGIGGFFVNTGAGLLIAANDANNINDLEFKVDANGNVFADGTYHCGANIDDAAGDLSEGELDPCVRDSSPADFAELFPGEPGLAPGEVAALDRDGRLIRTRLPNDPRVVGVISTRPSYLGNARHAGKPGWAALALTGVVPVRVTDEGGVISPGDWLVASSTAGRAMRCDGATTCAGRTIGKALDAGTDGTGVVRMLVISR